MWDAWPAARPLIISHRGLAPGQRENTLQGVEMAFASGADAVEVDVRLSADGVLLLHHDRELGDHIVADTSFETLASQAQAEGYELARVRPVLERASGYGAVNLEIKDPAATGPVLEALEELEPSAVLVTGFDPRVVRAVDERRARTPTGLILGPHRGYRLLFSRRRVRRLRSWMQGTEPDAVVLHRSFLRAGLASAVFALDLPVLVWTVNRGRGLTRTTRHPLVSGVITDRPTAAHRARSMVQAARRRWTPTPIADESVIHRTVRGNQDRA